MIYGVMGRERGFNGEGEWDGGGWGIMEVMGSWFEWVEEVRDWEGKYREEDLYKGEMCID